VFFKGFGGFLKGFGWVFKGFGWFFKVTQLPKNPRKSPGNTMVPMVQCSRSFGGMGTRKGDPTGEDNIQGWSIIF